MTTKSRPRVAVLYQAVDPPIVNGVSKPRKPGGYQDSGADIAYALRHSGIADIVTLSRLLSLVSHEDWCFPDTEDGVLAAVEKGADVLWANTSLFTSHPLQTSARLLPYLDDISVVGQPPQLVEQYDDKNYVNALLRETPLRFNMPRCWIVDARQQTTESFVSTQDLMYPVICKPIRGRGSHGVKLCTNSVELRFHLVHLSGESPVVMIEEFLAGEEGTITVMPPSENHDEYWAMPIVVRFNHQAGISPYNGVVAVTQNSKVLPEEEAASNPSFGMAARQCEEAARLLKVTSPIRIDVRRYKDSSTSPFALFDVNMKPNMTGPGRPGREDQSSLTAIAAAELGWDYSQLLAKILATARPLAKLRTMAPEHDIRSLSFPTSGAISGQQATTMSAS